VNEWCHVRPSLFSFFGWSVFFPFFPFFSSLPHDNRQPEQKEKLENGFARNLRQPLPPDKRLFSLPLFFYSPPREAPSVCFRFTTLHRWLKLRGAVSHVIPLWKCFFFFFFFPSFLRPCEDQLTREARKEVRSSTMIISPSSIPFFFSSLPSPPPCLSEAACLAGKIEQTILPDESTGDWNGPAVFRPLSATLFLPLLFFEPLWRHLRKVSDEAGRAPAVPFLS